MGERMRRTYLEVYVHFVWATWDRLPVLIPGIRDRVFRAILAKCDELGCRAEAIGGVDDHMHLLVKMSSTVSLADLVKGVKGSTSHLTTHAIAPGQFFKWQGSYGAISVSPGDVERVINYVRNQEKHHGGAGLLDDFEKCEEFQDPA
jgi:REP element-mobilizing transposase RayT